MITRDYLMEEAERLSKLIAAVVFQKHLEEVRSGEEYTIPQDSMLLGDLRRLILTGDINDAENLLFERLSIEPSSHNLAIAGIFYRDISQFSDEELDRAGFSRQEIMEGLKSVERITKASRE